MLATMRVVVMSSEQAVAATVSAKTSKDNFPSCYTIHSVTDLMNKMIKKIVILIIFVASWKYSLILLFHYAINYI